MRICTTHCGRILWILTLGSLSAACAIADDCSYTAPFEEVVDAAGASGIEIDAAAGYLKVVGRDGLGEVRVRGTGCASSEKLLGEIELTVDRRGDRVRVLVEMPESSWRSQIARLDLDIEVPSGLPLDVDDGSGALEIHGVASARIDDGSGEIGVRDVAGDLRIDDGSGEIRVEDVAGEVWIRDGSGEIDVRRAGSVTIDEDGSGSIHVADVTGDVTVRDDGSGSIRVAGVGGDFTVRDDGSGGISHRDVAGRVSVPADD